MSASIKIEKSNPTEHRNEDNQERQLSVEAEDVSLTYRDGTEAVKDISIDIPRGEFFGLLGPNGAGKTTFIKILTTLLKPTKGRAEVNGFEVGRDSQAVRESIGYMHQETRIDTELSARENIRFACEAYGISKSKKEARIDELLELVELSDVADKKAKDFSGGMKKRLDVATALVHEPPLIFLDEPTTGLDPKSKKKLWRYFERINDEGNTIFLTTQYLEEADRLCDRIAVIQDGEIIADNSPHGLKKKVGGYILDIELESSEGIGEAVEMVKKTDIFDDNFTISSKEDVLSIASNQARERGVDLLVKLRNSGFEIECFNLHEPTLDDVFLTITGEETTQNKEESE